jgi:hypothetical protein
MAGVTDGIYSKAVENLRNAQLGEWGRTWNREQVERVLEAASEIDIKAYEDWANQFYDANGKKIGSKSSIEMIAVGAIDIRTFDFLVKKNKTPLTPTIVATKEKFGHASRDSKIERGKALTKEQMLAIPYNLKHPKAILWDKEYESVLYAFNVDGDNDAKMIVKVNYFVKPIHKQEIGKRNVMVSAGIVKKHNLKQSKYEIIQGDLK